MGLADEPLTEIPGDPLVTVLVVLHPSAAAVRDR